jgi:lysyl-tRNA synthetase class 2
VDLFGFIPGYRGVIFHEGKEPLFLSLLAFVITFCCTRGYTRMARKYGWGSGSVGGVHLHHEVVGIVFVLVAGLVAMTPVGTHTTVRNFCAILFGVGAAFILDEFALVFYLRDVYWTQEGRDSVDATILAVMITALVLVGSEPFGLSDPVNSHLDRFVFFAVIAANASFALVSLLKGKLYTGFAALALPPLGWVGAIRLAKPMSPWAHRFYGPEKLERARHRMRHGIAARFQQRLVDLVGGDTSTDEVGSETPLTGA